jgi:hypothetical protein
MGADAEAVAEALDGLVNLGLGGGEVRGGGRELGALGVAGGGDVHRGTAATGDTNPTRKSSVGFMSPPRAQLVDARQVVKGHARPRSRPSPGCSVPATG